MIYLHFIVSIRANEEHATAHRVRQDRVNHVEGSAISPLYVIQKELSMQYNTRKKKAFICQPTEASVLDQ